MNLNCEAAKELVQEIIKLENEIEGLRRVPHPDDSTIDTLCEMVHDKRLELARLSADEVIVAPV
jgi:hypothetical protein